MKAIWEEGMGQVLISRELPNRKVAIATFLLDVYCLGVKDAMFDIGERERYDRQIYGHLTRNFATAALRPECARTLIEGGVDYALNLDLQPHADYGQAKLIFGDIDPETCTRTFEYGKDGKPYFIAGPHDGEERCAQIIRILAARCGPDGFHFLAPIRKMDSLPSGMRFLEDDREI